MFGMSKGQSRFIAIIFGVGMITAALLALTAAAGVSYLIYRGITAVLL